MADIDKILEVYKRLFLAVNCLKESVPGRTRRALTLKIDRRLAELEKFDNPLAKPEAVHNFLRACDLKWGEKREESKCITG